MKVIVTESKLGVEYIADVISCCNQNGVECIVDDKNNDIFYYDPKRHKYGDDKLLHDNDVSIWDIVSDEKLFDDILFDASGAIFKDFAVRWNDLQKKGDEDEVFKTDHCNPIRGNFSEKGKEDFGDRVNGIEARVSESDDPRDWSSSEGEVEIEWVTDRYAKQGIESGDTETVLIDYDLVDDNDDLDWEVERMVEKAHPDLDFDTDEYEILNREEFWMQRKVGKELADGCSEVEGIPDWATNYLVNGDDSGLSEEDKADVDRYVDTLASEGLALAHPIEGTEKEFDRYPAFGKACATSTWIANEI